LRIVYIGEFLLAQIAVYTVWSQVGGQGHLDQMPWYMKLSIGTLLSYAIVRATAAAASEDRGWNSRALRWTGIVALLGVLAGAVTYYEHLYEPSDDNDNEQTMTSWSSASVPPVFRSSDIFSGQAKTRDSQNSAGKPLPDGRGSVSAVVPPRLSEPRPQGA